MFIICLESLHAEQGRRARRRYRPQVGYWEARGSGQCVIPYAQGIGPGVAVGGATASTAPAAGTPTAQRTCPVHSLAARHAAHPSRETAYQGITLITSAIIISVKHCEVCGPCGLASGVIMKAGAGGKGFWRGARQGWGQIHVSKYKYRVFTGYANTNSNIYLAPSLVRGG